MALRGGATVNKPLIFAFALIVLLATSGWALELPERWAYALDAEAPVEFSPAPLALPQRPAPP